MGSRTLIKPLISEQSLLLPPQMYGKIAKRKENKCFKYVLEIPAFRLYVSCCGFLFPHKHFLLRFITCYFIHFHQGVFSEVVGVKRRGTQEDGGEHPKNKKRSQTGKDEDYYIPYKPKDFESERG